MQNSLKKMALAALVRNCSRFPSLEMPEEPVSSDIFGYDMTKFKFSWKDSKRWWAWMLTERDCKEVVSKLHEHLTLFKIEQVFNPSSPKGGLYQPPLTVFALVLKIAQPRGKIAPGTFKFTLSLHFSEKIPNLPPTPGVG